MEPKSHWTRRASYTRYAKYSSWVCGAAILVSWSGCAEPLGSHPIDGGAVDATDDALPPRDARLDTGHQTNLDAEGADPGFSVGTPEVNASGSTEEGDLLTLRTDGAMSFGSHGPTLAVRITLAGQANGERLDFTQLEGSAEFGGSQLGIEDHPALPYGRGLQIGTSGMEQNSTGTARLRVTTGRATEIYEAVTILWPEAHQTASIPALDGAATWQVKSIWHMFEADGYNAAGKSDYFGGLPHWYNSTEAWTCGRAIGSNSRPTSTFTSCPGDSVRDPDGPGWRSEPLYRQLWTRHGPDSASAAGSDGMLRVTTASQGLVFEETYADAGRWDESGAITTGVDRFTLPGYVRGFNIPLGRHMFFSDVYVAHSLGPGAAARVEVGDAATYAECTQLSVFNIESWSEFEVQAVVRKGAFHARSLAGLHLFVTNADNETLYVGEVR